MALSANLRTLKESQSLYFQLKFVVLTTCIKWADGSGVVAGKTKFGFKLPDPCKGTLG